MWFFFPATFYLLQSRKWNAHKSNINICWKIFKDILCLKYKISPSTSSKVPTECYSLWYICVESDRRTTATAQRGVNKQVVRWSATLQNDTVHMRQYVVMAMSYCLPQHVLLAFSSTFDDSCLCSINVTLHSFSHFTTLMVFKEAPPRSFLREPTALVSVSQCFCR